MPNDTITTATLRDALTLHNRDKLQRLTHGLIAAMLAPDATLDGLRDLATVAALPYVAVEANGSETRYATAEQAGLRSWGGSGIPVYQEAIEIDGSVSRARIG
jgi:hypothetical protein